MSADDGYPKQVIPPVANQGQWGSCTIFALARVIRDILLSHFDLDPGSPDHVAELITARCPHNAGKLVGENGIAAGELVKQINAWMRPGQLPSFVMDVRCGGKEKVKVRFQIGTEEKLKSIAEFWNYVKGQDFKHPQNIAKRYKRKWYHTVVVGKGFKTIFENGENKTIEYDHSMQGFSATSSSVTCTNSWGNDQKVIVIPGEPFKIFTFAEYFTLYEVQIMEKPEKLVKGKKEGGWKTAELVDLNQSKLGGVAIGGAGDVPPSGFGNAARVFIPSALRYRQWRRSPKYDEELCT